MAILERESHRYWGNMGSIILPTGRFSDRLNMRFSRISQIVPKQPYQNLRGFKVFFEVVAVEVLFSRELWGFLGGLFPALRLRGDF
jgi:hypothetical protein